MGKDRVHAASLRDSVGDDAYQADEGFFLLGFDRLWKELHC